MHEIDRLGKDRKKLADLIFEEFENNIRQGLLKEGDRLPAESALVQAYGVSRTVVREAMSQLQAARLVTTRHGIGTFVQAAAQADLAQGFSQHEQMASGDVVDVLNYRIALESECAALAATLRTDEQLAAIALAHRQYGASIPHVGDTIRFDIAFHMAIAAASGNRYLIDALAVLVPKFIPRQRIGSVHRPQNDPYFLDRIHREHDEIHASIVKQDPDGARAAMRIHLNNSRDRILLRLQAGQARGTVAPDRRPS